MYNLFLLPNQVGNEVETENNAFLFSFSLQSRLWLIFMRFCFPALCWEPRAAALPASTVRVRVGEDATLHCPLLDSASANDSLTVSWYRKPAGHSPQLLLSLRAADGSKAKYGAGVRAHKVSAWPNGTLLLRGSEYSDSAVYYCGASHGLEQDRKQPED